MKRRDFDRHALLALARGPWQGVSSKGAARCRFGSAALVRCKHPAMATVFETVMPWREDAAAWAQHLFQIIDDIESQLTVYRNDSEISVINRLAFDRSVEVEPRLFELFQKSEKLTRETWGAFDITMGPLIRAWGFWRRQGRIPPPQERHQAWQRVGMHRVELTADRRTIRFQKAGMELNLGSIGKGYALDRCFEMARDAGFQSLLMHAGGSSVRAVGNQPGCKGWSVGIRHPWEAHRRIALLTLCDRALATSAATHQHFEHLGRKFGHLLDPRTGRPAEGVASATAVAPTAAEADALSTAFFILGLEKTRLYCSKHPDVGAIILVEGAEQPEVINLPDANVSLLPPPS